MGGMVLETNMAEITNRIEEQNKIEKQEVSQTLIHSFLTLVITVMNVICNEFKLLFNKTIKHSNNF